MKKLEGLDLALNKAQVERIAILKEYADLKNKLYDINKTILKLEYRISKGKK